MIAGLGYAVPGTVLALGLLSPLVGIDEAINWVTRTVAGVGVGLVVAGSGAALVIAYVMRFLAIATGSAQAGLARISTAYRRCRAHARRQALRSRARSTCRWRGPRSRARRCSSSSIA